MADPGASQGESTFYSSMALLKNLQNIQSAYEAILDAGIMIKIHALTH